MLVKSVLLGAAGTALFSFTNQKTYKAEKNARERIAIAILYPAPGHDVTGAVTFYQKDLHSKTQITARLKNLNPNGLFGFHIHEFGDLTNGTESVGPHYNPFDKKHGSPRDNESHMGDLGNIKADDLGYGYYTSENNKVTLFGEYSVVGRSVLVNKNEDDLGRGNHPDSHTNGHSGPRIAAGIIGLAYELKNLPARF
ncbi:hypothetical protein ABPG72_016076 [Tetrahymena utriculariae]